MKKFIASKLQAVGWHLNLHLSNQIQELNRSLSEKAEDGCAIAAPTAESAEAAPPAAIPAPAKPDINVLLHHGRSAYLRRIPPSSGTMLSAGCSGLWYFDWIAEKTGHVGRHIGLEYYSPKPDGLPETVDWIANTVGNMAGVKDGECSFLFSGQNIEHLWPEEILGFLLESWRVLEPGGLLVIDSPNRLITEKLVWSHPEHIIELTPDEARRLVELAGFDVSVVKGLWLCRDGLSGEILPFEPRPDDERWSLVERLMDAQEAPDDSFIWWLEARKSDRKPQAKALKREIDKIYAEAWPERSRRFLSIVGARLQLPDGASAIRSEPGEGGPLVYGPFMPLRAGRHTVKFWLEADSNDSGPIVRLDVLGQDGRELAVVVLAGDELKALGGEVVLAFELPGLEFGVQARCVALGKAAITCRLPVEIL